MKQARQLAAIERREWTAKAEAPAENRGRARISAETTDRMGDVVVAEGAQIENYLKNPVVLYAHDSRSLPVGRATDLSIVKGEGVDAEWEWAPHPEAQVVRSLWEGGFLNATSIGFRPLTYEELEADDNAWWPPLKFLEWELLEFSIVPVPANQDALRLALAEFDAGRPDQLKAIVARAGRVLSAANETNLRDARDLIDKVLAAVETDDGKSAPVELAAVEAAEEPAPEETPAADEPAEADEETPDPAALAADVLAQVEATVVDALTEALAGALGITPADEDDAGDDEPA